MGLFWHGFYFLIFYMKNFLSQIDNMFTMFIFSFHFFCFPFVMHVNLFYSVISNIKINTYFMDVYVCVYWENVATKS